MEDPNAVLTALGLDTSQYEDGINRATSATLGLVKVLNGFDESIRKIPLIGEVWEQTGGKIIDSLAEIRQQSREFSRVMSTEVGGSLEGTLTQLGEVQKLIADNKNSIFSRALLRGDGIISDRGSRELNQLEERRRELMAGLTKEFDRQNEASSSILAHSEKQSELTRIDLERQTALSKIEAEKEQYFGPDPDRKADVWQKSWDYGVAREKQITQFYDAQAQLVEARDKILKESNTYEEESARIATNRLPVDQAILDVKHAEQEYDIASKYLDEEAIDAAKTKLGIANEQYNAAVREKKIKEEQNRDDAAASRLRLTGSASQQFEQQIRGKFDIPIREALRRGDQSTADSLMSQAGDETLGFQIQQRLMGGALRSAQRQELRTRLREYRTQEAINKEANLAAQARNSPDNPNFTKEPDQYGNDIDKPIGNRLTDPKWSRFNNARGGVESDTDTQAAPDNSFSAALEPTNSKLDSILQQIQGGNG